MNGVCFDILLSQYRMDVFHDVLGNYCAVIIVFIYNSLLCNVLKLSAIEGPAYNETSCETLNHLEFSE